MKQVRIDDLKITVAYCRTSRPFLRINADEQLWGKLSAFQTHGCDEIAYASSL